MTSDSVIIKVKYQKEKNIYKIIRLTLFWSTMNSTNEQCGELHQLKLAADV